MEVPFFDLRRQYANIEGDVKSALEGVLKNCDFVAGPRVGKFEEIFAQYCGAKFAVGVNSGTTAVYLALKALGIGNHDEVLTSVNTFFATAEAISLTGAEPAFIDIDEASYNISPQKILEYFDECCVWDNKMEVLLDVRNRKRVRAILPVHLYGQMADMEPILNIAEKYGLYVVEDAAQAHGAQYKNNGAYKKAGTFAHIAAFSFYPSKNLGAYGNGGAVVTDDESLEKKVRMLVDHGQSKKYYHNVLGWNFKMNGFQGAILSEKLKYLDGWNDARRQNAMRYELAFEGIEEVILPREAELCKHVYHLFVVRTKERKEFQDYLKSKGIGTGIHYPIPLHLQEAYGHLGYQEGDFPVAEKLAHEVVSLPMFPELHDEEIEYVGRKAREYFTQAG